VEDGTEERTRRGQGAEGAEARIDKLEALVASQAAMLDAQQQVIEALRDRVDRFDAVGGDAPRGPAVSTTAEPPSATGADTEPATLTTSRRALLRKGTAAAAGAAIVGGALSVATATPAAAAAGNFDGDPAVKGTANPTSGIGVHGTTLSGTGVYGTATSLTANSRGVFGTSTSTSGTGVRGENLVQSGQTRGVAGYVASDAGVAVAGVAGSGTGEAIGVSGISYSTTGVGVDGRALAATGTGVALRGEVTSANGYAVRADALTGTAVLAESGRTQLQFGGAPAAPLGAALARTRGELVFDANGDLWLCIAAGTPGTWRRVSGTNTAGALRVLPSTIRIYDSRPGAQPPGVQKGKFVDHEERVIAATLGSATPAGATAVLINATATDTNPGGFFAFFKNGTAWPNNSSLSWGTANATIANLAVVAVDATAKFKARMEGPGGANLVIDCIGYYQ
jgi:hypothetical protein